MYDFKEKNQRLSTNTGGFKKTNIWVVFCDIYESGENEDVVSDVRMRSAWKRGNDFNKI